MKETKFRAYIRSKNRRNGTYVWKKKTNPTVKSFDGEPLLLYHDDGAFSYPKERFVLVEYIGENGIEGKEIYGGDLVKFKDAIGKVVWREYFWFVEQIEPEMKTFRDIFYNKFYCNMEGISPYFDWNELEIIGNVYEGIYEKPSEDDSENGKIFTKEELLEFMLGFAERDANYGGGYENGYRACAEAMIDSLELEKKKEKMPEVSH